MIINPRLEDLGWVYSHTATTMVDSRTAIMRIAPFTGKHEYSYQDTELAVYAAHQAHIDKITGRTTLTRRSD